MAMDSQTLLDSHAYLDPRLHLRLGATHDSTPCATARPIVLLLLRLRPHVAYISDDHSIPSGHGGRLFCAYFTRSKVGATTPRLEPSVVPQLYKNQYCIHFSYERIHEVSDNPHGVVSGTGFRDHVSIMLVAWRAVAIRGRRDSESLAFPCSRLTYLTVMTQGSRSFSGASVPEHHCIACPRWRHCNGDWKQDLCWT